MNSKHPHVAAADLGERATEKEVRAVLAGLMIVFSLGALDQSIVATALPRIVGELGGVTRLTWIVTAYVLSSTSRPLAVLAFALLAWGAATARGFYVIEPCIFSLGLGLGFVMPNMTIAAQNTLSAAHRGVGTATLAFFVHWGGREIPLRSESQ